MEQLLVQEQRNGQIYMADGSAILLGDDQDVSLTHVADAGVLINDDNSFNSETMKSKLIHLRMDN